MKISRFGFVVALALLLGAGAAHADDRDSRRDRGFADGDGWRLGERVRGGFAIYRRAGRGWQRVPGQAIAVADGWVLGSKRESGGYAIYRWNGYGWDQAPGGAVRIGGSYNRPWVVNDRGRRFVWNGYDWDAAFTGHNSRNTRYGRGYRGNRHFSFERHDRRRIDKHRDRRRPNSSRGRRHSNW